MEVHDLVDAILWIRYTGVMSHDGTLRTRAGIGKDKAWKVHHTHTKLSFSSSLTFLTKYFPGVHSRHVRKWLRPDEFGLDGHPLPSAMPPTSPVTYQQPPVSAFQPGDFDASASSLTQQSLACAPLSGHPDLPGLPSQGFSNYRSYGSNLSRGRDT